MSVFTTFINHAHPVYQGKTNDGTEMKIVLSNWFDNFAYGSGEIYPYTIPSMVQDTDPHQGCFDFSSFIEAFCFTADDYSESTVLAFNPSHDFTHITVLDHRSMPTKEFGSLHLVKEKQE